MISKLHRRQLLVMASLLTSDSDYFTAIAENKNGSIRVQMLLRKSDDVDSFLCTTILRHFLKIMTDMHASDVAVRTMVVFDEEKKKAMYKHTLHHAMDSARDIHSCIVLNEVIPDLDDHFYTNQLLDLVAQNSLCLSNHVYGNFVIQHVLKLNDLRCTHHLRGHCVDLSFKKHGSYIVQRLFGGCGGVNGCGGGGAFGVQHRKVDKAGEK